MKRCCYECGKGIKGRCILIEPCILDQRLGVDFPKAYHPACYTRAERDAARLLRTSNTRWPI